MLHQHHFLQKSLCLILILSLLLLTVGCGEQSENTDSSPSTTAGTDLSQEERFSGESLEESSEESPEESSEETEVIQDRFIMLREVYDILSGPLGEPYRTPKYWGGEEIDMMKAGNNYLIALRNVQNQMHYLLYERETDSIVEIDIQGKRIIWEKIFYSPEINTLSFSFYEEQSKNLSELVPHAINYSVDSRAISFSELPHQEGDSAVQNLLWDIPEPSAQIPLTDDFSFLLDLYTALKKQPDLEYVYGNNIAVLNRENDILFHMLSEWEVYENFLYEKSSAHIVSFPRQIVDPEMIHWESMRFQKEENPVCFPCLGRKRFEPQKFPSVFLYNKESGEYIQHPLPLWRSDRDYSFRYGLDADLPFLIDGLDADKNSLILHFTLTDKHRILDEIYPCFVLTSDTDRTVTFLFEHCTFSKEIKSGNIDSFPGLQISNFENVTISLKEPDFYGEIRIPAARLTLRVSEGYSVFGDMEQEFISDEKTGNTIGATAKMKLWKKRCAS